MGIGVSGALFGLGVSSVFAQWTNSMDLSSFRVVRFGRAALAVSGALMEYSWDDLCESGSRLHATNSRVVSMCTACIVIQDRERYR